jgi:drug/metabolite transporter (DMT)-like permease
MLRGGVIVVTALFSVIFLKNKLDKSQYLGCGLSIAGIIIVGLSAVLYPRNGGENNSSVIIKILF